MTPFDPPAQKQRARLEQAALLKAHKERRRQTSEMLRDLDRSIWRDALRNFDSDFDRIFVGGSERGGRRGGNGG